MAEPLRQKVEMLPVSSSNVTHVGYDPESGDLHVVFRKTGLYVYHGVRPETYQSLINSTSIGGFLADFIKPVHGHRRG